MRTETDEWLDPLVTAAQEAGIDLMEAVMSSRMPISEAADAALESAMTTATENPAATVSAIDWVRVGQRLRDQLGWNDTYPAFPDFPETRDTP